MLGVKQRKGVDERQLSPISGQGKDFLGGWAATLVDVLDTLWTMDMKTEFYQAAQAADSIEFSTSTGATINIFESTIRYLGGLLSAYDLSGEAFLLQKAYQVGEMLLVAFDTQNHMPITRWNWTEAATGTKPQSHKSRQTARSFPNLAPSRSSSPA